MSELDIIFDRIVTQKTQIRRERRLEGSGQVLVTQGTLLSPSDVVAESQQPGPARLIDVARELDVAPRKIEKLLLVDVGEAVEEGQPIIKRGRLFSKKALHAPMNGTLVAVGERGHLIIRGEPRRQQLRALIQGTVAVVNPVQGVTIEANGALVQGLWGNGREDFGLLQLRVDDPEESITPAAINAGMRGTIIVGGITMDERTLYRAAEVQAKGVIIGSLPQHLIDFARKLPLPVMLTEGFGQHPICQPIFDLLKKLDGRDATLIARYGMENGRNRPELFVPLLGEAPPLMPPGPLAPNDRVRILSGRHFGRTGTVEGNGPTRQQLPNEINAMVWHVRLDSGEQIPIPSTNLERLIQ